MGCRLILGIALGFTICYVALAAGDFEDDGGPRDRFRRLKDGIQQSTMAHPMVVKIEYFDKFICDASMIHEKIALTAAHCVEGKVIQGLNVKYGDFSPNSIGIAMKVRHPEYNSVTYYNDAAILKLKKAVTKSPNSFFVTLSDALIVDFKEGTELVSYPDVSLTTKANDEGDVHLTEFKTRIIPKAECARMYGNLTVESLKGQICSVPIPENQSNASRSKRSVTAVGPNKSTVAINKGTGSAVMRSSTSRDQVAIVSSSSACGLDVPDIYTLVPPIREWIEDVKNDMVNGVDSPGEVFGLSEDEVKFYKNLPAYPVKLTKASFLVPIVDSETKNLRCVGAILSPDLIVTTARNCADAGASKLEVLIDSTRTKNKDKYYAVHDYKVHSKYDEKDHMTKHNLAVLHLRTPLEFNEYVNKTELTDRRITPGQITNIYGYDKTSKAKSLSLVVGHNEECEFYHSRLVVGESGRICAKRRLGMCLNPVGAPLLSGKNLVGLLSLQFSECSDYRQPIVFTDLTWSDNQSFLSWMIHYIWKDEV